MLRPIFVQQMRATTDDGGVRLRWHSDYWVAELCNGDLTLYVIGNHFPLNNAASAQVANDKAAAYDVLAANGVPAVPHFIVRPTGLTMPELVAAVHAVVQLPLVVKPHIESGGIDVYRASRSHELQDVLVMMAQRYRALAVSPFLDIADEYRAVMLDGTVQFAFRKVRSATTVAEGSEEPEWRHNLRLGARPELLWPGEVADLLGPLAQRAVTTLGLRFATVDVVATRDGLQVLEVNSAVTLEKFSSYASNNYELAAATYQEAVRRCFEHR